MPRAGAVNYSCVVRSHLLRDLLLNEATDIARDLLAFLWQICLRARIAWGAIAAKGVNVARLRSRAAAAARGSFHQ